MAEPCPGSLQFALSARENVGGAVDPRAIKSLTVSQSVQRQWGFLRDLVTRIRPSGRAIVATSRRVWTKDEVLRHHDDPNDRLRIQLILRVGRGAARSGIFQVLYWPGLHPRASFRPSGQVQALKNWKICNGNSSSVRGPSDGPFRICFVNMVLVGSSVASETHARRTGRGVACYQRFLPLHHPTTRREFPFSSSGFGRLWLSCLCSGDSAAATAQAGYKRE